MNNQLQALTLIAVFSFSGIANAAPVTVFSTDFNSVTLLAEISPGTALITGVQGYASLGPVGNQFGGAAVWLFGSGLLGLVGVARRKKAA